MTKLEETVNISISDLDGQLKQLWQCKPLKESQVRELCNKAKELLIEESNIQNISAPITVSYFLFVCFT